MQLKIAGTVILYHPDAHIAERITSYTSGLGQLYVFDNTERKSDDHPKPNLAGVANHLYLHDGTNQGIAACLNQACTRAIAEGFDWLLTMDQDSFFLDHNWQQFLACVGNDVTKESAAIYGPVVEKKEGAAAACTAIAVRHLITSGSILNLKLYQEVGPFDERLFIDQVDFDYGYRCLLKGYRLVQMANIHMEHSLGLISQHRSMKNFQVTERNLHAPIRMYYLVRNTLYLRKKYRKAFLTEVKLVEKDLFVRIKNNILYNNRSAVLKYIFRGLLDYYRGRWGRFSG